MRRLSRGSCDNGISITALRWRDAPNQSPINFLDSPAAKLGSKILESRLRFRYHDKT